MQYARFTPRSLLEEPPWTMCHTKGVINRPRKPPACAPLSSPLHSPPLCCFHQRLNLRSGTEETILKKLRNITKGFWGVNFCCHSSDLQWLGFNDLFHMTSLTWNFGESSWWLDCVEAAFLNIGFTDLPGSSTKTRTEMSNQNLIPNMKRRTSVAVVEKIEKPTNQPTNQPTNYLSRDDIS